jgi:hypothetical protein
MSPAAGRADASRLPSRSPGAPHAAREKTIPRRPCCSIGGCAASAPGRSRRGPGAAAGWPRKSAGNGWHRRRAPARSSRACPPLHRVQAGLRRRIGHPQLAIHLANSPDVPDQPHDLFARLLAVRRARQRDPLPVHLDAERLDHEAYLLDQPHEYGRLRRLRTRWRHGGLGARRRRRGAHPKSSADALHELDHGH